MGVRNRRLREIQNGNSENLDLVQGNLVPETTIDGGIEKQNEALDWPKIDENAPANSGGV